MEGSEITTSSGIPDGQTINFLTAGDRAEKAKASVWKDLLAGGIAGTSGIAIGHPFDTIKVRLQQKRERPSCPKIPVAMKESNLSMYRGLYRGIGAPLATAAVVNASVFCVYGATSRLWDNLHPAVSPTEQSNLTTTSFTKHAVCGSVTGLTTSLLLCPIEYVKIRLQTMQLQPAVGSTPRPYSDVLPNSSFRLAKEIISSHHGFSGLFRGLFATILRQTPSLAVYFPVYHLLEESLDEFYSNRNRKSSNNNDNKDTLWWSSALAGGLAGCLAWTIVYPIDVVKSRIQSLPLDVPAKERSFLHIARRIARNEGFTRLLFSRGLVVTLLRAFPVNGTIFFVYESVDQRLRRLDDYDWEDEKGVVNADYNSASIENRLETMPRRKLTLRMDDAVLSVRDAPYRERKSH